jgi:hypothetical protein
MLGADLEARPDGVGQVIALTATAGHLAAQRLRTTVNCTGRAMGLGRDDGGHQKRDDGDCKYNVGHGCSPISQRQTAPSKG